MSPWNFNPPLQDLYVLKSGVWYKPKLFHGLEGIFDVDRILLLAQTLPSS